MLVTFMYICNFFLESKMTQLRQRIKELLKRVDQLTDLLRAANIVIPPLEAYPDDPKNLNAFKWMNQRPKKWTEKINLVVPDDKIKSVLSLIKDYKKTNGKFSSKKKVKNKSVEKMEVNANQSGLLRSNEKKKKLLKKSRKIINLKAGKRTHEKSDLFNESQSPSQFKENNPVDFNLLSINSNKCDNSGVTCNNITYEAASKKSVSCAKSSNMQPVIPANGNPIQQQSQQNILVPATSNVLQSNTYILTNDGNLVQLPILNPSATVFGTNSNLLAPTTVVKPNTGLLTPIVLNKPSPVIVLQKPAPQIIQTAQILNAAPQIISVSKPSIQILNSPILSCATTNPVVTPKPLAHILSKAPSNKKRILRDSTVTTFVNKIPIPALLKHSHGKKSPSEHSVGDKNKSTNTKINESESKTINSENDNNKIVQNNEQNSKENHENEKLNESGSHIGNKNENEKDREIIAPHKRNLNDDKIEKTKKQKLEENLSENVFRPIENPIETDAMFCNLGLPSAMNPSLSVSPTAAFLSSFPIVASIRLEAEDDMGEKKVDDGKVEKHETQDSASENNQEGHTSSTSRVKNNPSKEFPSAKDSNNLQSQSSDKKKENNQLKLISDANPVASNKIKFTNTEVSTNHETESNISNPVNDSSKQMQQQTQISTFKAWDQYHQENCGIRSDSFFMPSEVQIHNNIPSIDTVNSSDINFPGMSTNIGDSPYKSYNQHATKTNCLGIQNTINDQVTLKTNPFEYTSKETFMDKVSNDYNERTVQKKHCSETGTNSYSASKNQSNNYEMDSGPTYQLIPAKDVPNQRNSRTVNWMTEPDNRSRGIVYGSETEKVTLSKAPTYVQTDSFYMNNQTSKISSDFSGNFITTDQNKSSYSKNDFYNKDQRCKVPDKRTDPKCYVKPSQNSYNIFDYDYVGSCYGEEDTNKYCNVQSYSNKSKKAVGAGKKKVDEIQQVTNDVTVDTNKRPTDQIISNLDFNSVSNQECFTWMPGKNVEWFPSKSFGLDTNLVVPSTLPTLVGDLALGTSTNDVTQIKASNSKVCQSNLKPILNDLPKDYVDLGMGSSMSGLKPTESIDTNKQYLEPFTNLSKNIFDVTPSNVQNSQMGKNDFNEKINFLQSNNNETIVLKNIFELPVSKSSGSDFNRNKHRSINNTQNTFLSVSQLVEPPAFDGNSMKDQVESTSAKVDPYNQNYINYSGQKTYKGKNRASQCKYNERKYAGYKNTTNGSSSYTAEALIRSNNGGGHYCNEFSNDIANTSFFNGKSTQKSEQFGGNNAEINMKNDLQGPSQNIYTDFNFSSPVPNFTIGSTVTTDFGNHDTSANFSTQNNTFFSDFIAPEYPLTDNVSNSLLLPPCSISLQNPFVLEKRNATVEKPKNTSKNCSTSRSRKQYDCAKTSYNEYSITSTTAIFTSASIACPSIFTTSACQNFLSVPTQSIPISFSSPTFTTGNISFPPLGTNNTYHKFPNPSQNSSSGSFLQSNNMFTSCTSKSVSSQNCYTSTSLTPSSNSVISSSFSVGNVTFPTSSQSSIPFFSLSNPIIPSSAPTSSGNSLANFNLSTIFPEINQKGSYHFS